MERNIIEMIRNRYPPGTRVELDSMDDPHAILPGTKGTVDFVDDIGDIFVNWDDGRALALVPGEDRFHKISAPEMDSPGISL